MSVWNPENIKDIAESVGIASLNEDLVQTLARDVEYRLSQILEEAMKFMRHSKRTTLSTQDISQALRVLDVEPLYGYESTRPLRFGEASIGPGQPLFYVEDEEMDFEKLINAPLPKVPREMSFTAHWLAVEGVQPSIPQNPTSAESRNQELLPRGTGANAGLGALTGGDSVNVKPLVKHILSKELQLYFERICSALLDENNEDFRVAALSSLRNDPGLHQLVPYFVQFISEKVTHHLKNIFILTQMMHLTSAMLDNETLYLDPYAASIIAPVLTCLIGRRLGDNTDPVAHYQLRNLSGSLLGLICKKYGHVSPTLKPRLARSCLKQFLDPNKPLAVHYGAIIGLQAIGGAETVRALILPNIKAYEVVLKDHLLTTNNPDAPAPTSDEPTSSSSSSRTDAEMVLGALVKALLSLERDYVPMMMNGHSGNGGEQLRERLESKLGVIVGDRIYELGRPRLSHAIVDDSIKIHD